ncbi:Hypothetical predicted protein [Lecanosticta acicola]|uniref:PH domain-containing protein n=1 Tax=Lecanosticta acicola TaxID=111012 RepID=A0AAI9EAP9_9PEZI|nr:Hypothetical predicted protein [Lecanosticta acicola]
MSARSSNESSTRSRRKSLLLNLSALTPVLSRDNRSNNTHHDDASARSPNTLKKHKHHRSRPPTAHHDLNHPDVAREDHTTSRPPSDQSAPGKSNARRPSLSMRVARRPPSVFGSLKSSVRASSEELSYFGYGHREGEPLSATSSKAPSLSLENAIDGMPPSKSVLVHGEVQTSAGMFRKKKEYLVLTEVHLIRYKSQHKAAETFKNTPLSNTAGRIPAVRHGSMPSAGSQSDLQTLSDSSGDKDGRVPLRQVVAVYKLDDGKPYFALEVGYLDEESGQASSINLQLGNPEDRDVWLQRIRSAVYDARLKEPSSISAFNLENVARVVERDSDYHPSNCAIFKVVQRQPTAKSGSRSSSDDVTKVASNVCFLAVGVHKVHFVQQVKPVARNSSPSLAAPGHAQSSHGILTLTAVKVHSLDDTFEITFRQPLQKARTLYLASSASHEIAARLRFSENFLRPECGYRLYRFSAPPEVEDLLVPPAAADVEEHCCLDRTLIAYCVAYGLNPSNLRYTINYHCEDAPRFELLPPADSRRQKYGPLELLAIMRSLRYNETFGSLSFASISLDSLQGLHDNYGQEHVCTRTKRGTPIKLSPEELNRSSLLVQEIRALAATSKRLRRLDFSGCITTKHASPDPTDDEPGRTRDIGCGIVEALFPLCKHQTTNVDWICLNGIELSDTDLDYLVGAAVDKSCHFRAIELNRCGLNDRSLGLILDALRAQENTLESLEIAGNGARLNPGAFDSQLAMFGFIRKLNLSNVSRTSSSEPFIQAETLLIWRLQELRLSGTTLNQATIDAISTYLAHPQSDSLHELYLDNTHIAGEDLATLLYSLSWDKDRVRNMHLDISQCFLTKGLEQLSKTIAKGMTPSHLSLRAIEYKEESQFRKIVAAVTVNKTMQYLDMSQTALPGDASEETCRLLSKLLAENETLVELDLSGDDSRLATSKFGPGINEALAGLKHNKTLKVFRIEKQKLGFQGASTLAEVLRENNTLMELHCDNNEIPLHGLTDLVNSLCENTSLVYLPKMNDGRSAAFRSAESTMKLMADQEAPGSPPHSRTGSFTASSTMKKGFANVKKTAQRSASIRTPSFPALPSSGKTSSNSRNRSHLSLSMPALKTKHVHPSLHSPTSIITGPLSGFTVQDIQTTHRLLTEQWDRQYYRLEQYLNRNWCLLNNIPCNMEIEEEKFERPSSVGSIGKMLEQVKYDTTPKAEKAQYFDSPLDAPPPPDLPNCSLQRSTTLENGDKHSVGFKHFILESGPQTQDLATALSQYTTSDTSVDAFDEPRTPTQKAFTTTSTASF